MTPDPGLPRPLPELLPAWADAFLCPNPRRRTAEDRMGLAVELARQNVLHRTGGPFGAAVFERDGGRLVAIGVNAVERLANSVLHAEVVAVMLAQAALGSHTLHAPGMPAHELVTSCEPCAMCLGAVLWSGVRGLVCGAAREDAAAIGFEEGPVFPESLGYLEARGVEIVRGVRRDEARAVLALYHAQGGLVYNG